MALMNIEHDATLQGSGTSSDPLGLTDRGWEQIDESPNRVVYYLEADRLSPEPGTTKDIAITDLAPNSIAPEPTYSIADSFGYMARIESITGGRATARTYYVPPVKDITDISTSSFKWSDIKGEVKDSASMLRYLGDTDSIAHIAPTIVDAINKIFDIIGPIQHSPI